MRNGCFVSAPAASRRRISAGRSSQPCGPESRTATSTASPKVFFNRNVFPCGRKGMAGRRSFSRDIAICQRASGRVSPTTNVGIGPTRRTRPAPRSGGVVSRPQGSTCRRSGPRQTTSSRGCGLQIASTASPGRANRAFGLPPGSFSAPRYSPPPSNVAAVRQGSSKSPGDPSGCINPQSAPKGTGQRMRLAPCVFASTMRWSKSSARASGAWVC